MTKPTDTKILPPVSAPPVTPGYDTDGEGNEIHEERVSPVGKIMDDKTREEHVQQFFEEHTPTPVIRQIMTISNDKNWMHYYSMPANVGMNQVPWLVQAMQSEGVALQDITISFKLEEVRQ